MNKTNQEINLQKDIKWIGIHGNTAKNGDELTFTPPPKSNKKKEIEEVEEDDDNGQLEISKPSGIIRSNIKFSEGTISWKTLLKNKDDICNVILNCEPQKAQQQATLELGHGSTQNPQVAFGLNCLRAPYGGGILINGQWRGLGGSGHGTQLPIDEWIEVKIHTRGSKTTLYVEDIEVLEIPQGVKPGPVGFYFEGMSPIKVKNVEVMSEQRKCFVVMQFTEKFNILYENVIKPTCSEFDYKVIRGDDFHKSEPILKDIIDSISEASLIIADITPDNSNVFYELGYAHALNKPTILLSDRSRENLPFDVSGFRTLFYENTIGGKSSIESRLRQFLKALED